MIDQTLETIVATVGKLDSKKVSKEVLDQTKLRILDYLGCVVGAFKEPIGSLVKQIAGRTRLSSDGVTLLGTNWQSSPDIACFGNGLLGRYLDFNDQYSGKTTGHPSDIIPAVLAAAELSQGDGHSVIAGTLVGYELFGRLCDSITLKPKWDHVTLGAIAAAGAAAKSLGLDEQSTKHAISIATVSNLSLDQTRRGELSHWKAGAFPNASRQGLFAALLAKDGLTGPDMPFDGAHGFWNAVGQPDDSSCLDSPFGKYKLLETAIKAHSACYLDLSAVDAIIELRKRVVIDDIESILVHTYQYSIDLTADVPSKWRPQTRETADHSMPYILATTLLEGFVDPKHYALDRLNDCEIHSLMDRIRVTENPIYSKNFPQVQTQRVEIITKSGDQLVEEVDYPTGHPCKPMSLPQIEAKFYRLVKDALPSNQAKDLVSEIMGIESSANLNDTLRLLVVKDE